MALPATHIRFAADMADSYPIHRLEPYVSGAMYPDSRRFTGIARKKTHAGIHLQRSFPDSDFTFGWHVHCLCDHLQAHIHNRMVPGLLKLNEQSRWIRLAAAKMVQDQHDMQQIDLDPLLDCLTYAEAPEGENITHIKSLQQAHTGYLPRKALSRARGLLWALDGCRRIIGYRRGPGVVDAADTRSQSAFRTDLFLLRNDAAPRVCFQPVLASAMNMSG